MKAHKRNPDFSFFKIMPSLNKKILQEGFISGIITLACKNSSMPDEKNFKLQFCSFYFYF